MQKPQCHDAIIVVPGIMGSVLVDASSGEELWSVGTIAAFLRRASLKKLETLRVDDNEKEGDARRIRAAGLMAKPWWLPGAPGAEPYEALVQNLRRRLAHPEALLEFAYDWRLSVDVNGRLLADALDQHLRRWRAHPSHESARLRHPAREPARVIVLAHSMGGLLCRAMIAHRGPDDVRTVVTMGTPFEGSIDAAMAMSSGDLDLLPAGLHLPRRAVRALACTLPGLHDLLPGYRCLADGADVRALTPADVAAFGGDGDLADRSARLAADLSKVVLPDHRAIVGTAQETPVTMRIDAGCVHGQPWKYQHDAADVLILDPVTQRPEQVAANGDGRVYDYAASLPGAKPLPVVQQHGELPRSGVVIDMLTHLLTHPGDPLDRRMNLGSSPQADAKGLGVIAPEAVAVDDPFELTVTGAADSHDFTVWLERADRPDDKFALERRSRAGDRAWSVPGTIDCPGLHRVMVSGGGEPVARLVFAVDD